MPSHFVIQKLTTDFKDMDKIQEKLNYFVPICTISVALENPDPRCSLMIYF